MSDYAAKQVQRVLDAGPAEGEDFFRVQISGAEKTHHLNITERQLRDIGVIVGRPDGVDALARIRQNDDIDAQRRVVADELDRLVGERVRITSGSYAPITGTLTRSAGTTHGFHTYHVTASGDRAARGFVLHFTTKIERKPEGHKRFATVWSV